MPVGSVRRSSRASSYSAACLLAAGVLACGGPRSGSDGGASDGGPGNPSDSGLVPDAGGRPDAGNTLDAGTDGGRHEDGGIDGATPGDAGTDAGQLDAGADGGEIDAGELDAGPDAGQPDAGSDAGMDGGLLDAGLVAGPFDGGQDAGQPDAGPGETLSLSVSVNPNSVMSAVAQVSWSGPLVSVYVSYEGGTWGPGQTPAVSLTNAASPLTVPVLTLQPDTQYEMHAVGQNADGGVLSSAVHEFTTGPLPSGFPEFVTAESDGGTPTPGYTMVARVPPASSRVDYVTIVDPAGNSVWYYNATSLAGEFEQQTDGTILVSVYTPAFRIAGLNDGPGVHRQIDVLGNLIRTWAAVDVPLATPPITVAATNSHDLHLLPDGEALLFGFVEQTVDMTAFGGPSNANVVGDVLERLTTAAEPTFAWNSFDYLEPSEIQPACARLSASTVDFTHANSIAVMDDGTYLIGSRNLSQAIKIDPASGNIIWRLGGQKSDFTFVNDSLNGFTCQHAVRELPNGDIILFDDGNGHHPQQSRAVEYALDLNAMTATLVWSATADPPLYTDVLGYAQRLDDGNTLITYGVTLQTQEVDAQGNLQWDLTTTTPSSGFYRAIHIDSPYPPSP